MAQTHDIDVDLMDMSNDGRLWVRPTDVHAGLVPIVGRFVIVGCPDADAAVARIQDVDADGNVELEVLSGSVEPIGSC